MIPRAGLIAVLFLGGCAGMVEKRVRTAMDEIWQEGHLALIDEAYAPEIAYEIKEFVAENRALYPDIEVTIDEVVVDLPQVVTRWTVRGTHKDLHKPVVLEGVSVRRLDGKKIVEEHMYFDRKSIYDQLGFTVTPPEGLSPFGVVVERQEDAGK